MLPHLLTSAPTKAETRREKAASPFTASQRRRQSNIQSGEIGGKLLEKSLKSLIGIPLTALQGFSGRGLTFPCVFALRVLVNRPPLYLREPYNDVNLLLETTGQAFTVQRETGSECSCRDLGSHAKPKPRRLKTHLRRAVFS